MRSVLLIVATFGLSFSVLRAQTSIYTQVGQVQGPSDAIAGIAISPDGRLIAYGTFADNLIRIVDVATRQEIRTLSGHTNRVTELVFSPNSQLLASQGTVNLSPGDGSVRLWNVSTGTHIATVATSGVSQLAFSPDGSTLAGASGGDPLNIYLWDASNLTLRRSISSVFRVLAFSPDGNRVATAKRNTSLYIMDTGSGYQIAAYTGHSGWVTATAYSANGQFLASAADDRSIRVWDPQTGQSTQTLTGHTTYPDFIAFRPDGAILASVGSGTNITRTSSGTSISISNADRFLRLWDLNTGTELTRVNIGSDVLSGVSFSANWGMLVTGSNTGLIRIYQGPATSVHTNNLPTTFELYQNYPNPFNPSTVIRYSLPGVGTWHDVSLRIYNLHGQEVVRLVGGVQEAGEHRVIWRPEGLPSGVYLYRLSSGNTVETKKLILLK